MIKISCGCSCNLANTSVVTMISNCEYCKGKVRLTIKIETGFPARSLMYNK